jgi:hypothetical protein
MEAGSANLTRSTYRFSVAEPKGQSPLRLWRRVALSDRRYFVQAGDCSREAGAMGLMQGIYGLYISRGLVRTRIYMHLAQFFANAVAAAARDGVARVEISEITPCSMA